jgi:hypothetical protein
VLAGGTQLQRPTAPTDRGVFATRPPAAPHNPPTTTTPTQKQAAELQRRLDTELPRDKLDMRHRLDEKGQRYGKVIDYK